MKNIEPGCNAIITFPLFYGWPVRVLYRAEGFGVHPDGTHFYSEIGHWAIESQGRSFREMKIGHQFSNRYASCDEKWLLRVDSVDFPVSTSEGHGVAA